MKLGDWLCHRQGDAGIINLHDVYHTVYGEFPKEAGDAYLDSVTAIHPIKSRQAAAIAVAMARFIDRS